MSTNDSVNNDSITWIPVCCRRVLRHNVFGSGASVAATLVCASCGKHIGLQPHTSGSIEDYDNGPHRLRVLGVSRPTQCDQQPTVTTASPDDEKTI